MTTDRGRLAIAVRRVLGRAPGVVATTRWGRVRFARARHRRENAAVLAGLRRCDHPLADALAEVLASLDDDLPGRVEDRLAGIEDERARLLLTDEPLVDGTIAGRVMVGDEGVTVGDAAWGSKGRPQARFLYRLAARLRPGTVVELGMNVGISSSYLATAVDDPDAGPRRGPGDDPGDGPGDGLGDDLGDGGGDAFAGDAPPATRAPSATVLSIEGSPYRLRIARDLHDRLGLRNVEHVGGRFEDVLATTLDDVVDRLGPVDLAFVDGHHHEGPTLEYLERLLPASGVHAVFVFDDIDHSDGMARAWSRLQDHPELGLLLDLGPVGIGVRGTGPSGRRTVLPPYRAFRG